jgi:hypothetical protein
VFWLSEIRGNVAEMGGKTNCEMYNELKTRRAMKKLLFPLIVFPEWLKATENNAIRRVKSSS